MFLCQQGEKFFEPELDLLLRGERIHVSNYRRFFLHDRIDQANWLDNFRTVAPDFGAVSMALEID